MASLETLIAENTAALGKLTAVSEMLLAARTTAIETVAAAAAPAPKTPTKAEKEAAAKAAADATKAAEAGADDKPQVTKNPEDRKEPAEQPGASTVADLGPHQIAAGKYLSATDDEAEREARRGKIKALLAHEKIKAPKLADVSPKMIPSVVAAIEKLIEAGNVIVAAPAEDEVQDLGV